MIDIEVIREIQTRAISSMQSDCDDEKISSVWKKTVFITVFYLLPLLAVCISWIRDIKLSSLENYIGTGIAIFTGLFFSLLLSIGDKVRNEQNNADKDSDNFQRYKTGMKQIANIILYTIIIGVVIFVILLINIILKIESCIYIEKVLTAFTLFFLVRFIVSLFFIVQRFYFLVRDELNNIL